jgi:hypothetical protein
MVTIPITVVIERDDEQVGLFELPQVERAVCSPSYGIA